MNLESGSMISQETYTMPFEQLYFFHSELFTYAVNTVTDMLSIIKNKTDKENATRNHLQLAYLKKTL